MKNAISWFEIPVRDLAKAQSFYEAILSCTLHREAMGPNEGAVFPYDEATGGVGGALLCGPMLEQGSGSGGTVVYLDCGVHSIDAVLERIKAAGGTVAMPRTPLPPGLGFIAFFLDLDGNKVGLHAMQ